MKSVILDIEQPEVEKTVYYTENEILVIVNYEGKMLVQYSKKQIDKELFFYVTNDNNIKVIKCESLYIEDATK